MPGRVGLRVFLSGGVFGARELSYYSRPVSLSFCKGRLSPRLALRTPCFHTAVTLFLLVTHAVTVLNRRCGVPPKTPMTTPMGAVLAPYVFHKPPERSLRRSREGLVCWLSFDR